MTLSITTSLLRVTLFWYVLGALVIFVGDPAWAEAVYTRLSLYPWVPVVDMHGLSTAASVQGHLLLYWTLPMLALWALALLVGLVAAESHHWTQSRYRDARLVPQGTFWGVTVPDYSLGSLPLATTPGLAGARVELPGPDGQFRNADAAHVNLQGALLDAVKALTPAERALSEDLLQLLMASPDHFAGHGHGVGLLEHTLNVVSEAASCCSADFRLPLLAALAHDIGKLISFKPDGAGGWRRQGLHSRESARILATLPGFQALPELHREALLLAVKYDHAPNKMPQLRGERESGLLAMRIISALSHADRTATAAEKDRNLEKIKPEDLLWQDFKNYLRDAPIVQRGKKGAANQVNNPPDSPYLYIYEAPWRDAAIPRLPAEVAAALDLTRRDAGKLAKYTRILVERLRKEGLLVEQHGEHQVTDTNPLWDIQSGTGEKAVVLRGILVLKADALWKVLNYRLSVKSPFPVQILAPNGAADGRINQAPSANRESPNLPEVSDGLKLPDAQDPSALAALGLVAPAPVAAAEGGAGVAEASAPLGDGAPATFASPAAAPKPKARRGFTTAQSSTADDDVLGLSAGKPGAPTAPPPRSAGSMPVPEAVVTPPESASPPPAVEPRAPEAPPVAPAPERVPAAMPEQPEAPPRPQAAPNPAAPADPAPGAPAAPAAPAELSRAEKREGLAIADAAACAQYPNLTVGDKYYTATSRAVGAGLKKPGSRYKGDDKSRQVELTAEGPRRGRRPTK